MWVRERHRSPWDGYQISHPWCMMHLVVVGLQEAMTLCAGMDRHVFSVSRIHTAVGLIGLTGLPCWWFYSRTVEVPWQSDKAFQPLILMIVSLLLPLTFQRSRLLLLLLQWLSNIAWRRPWAKEDTTMAWDEASRQWPSTKPIVAFRIGFPPIVPFNASWPFLTKPSPW